MRLGTYYRSLVLDRMNITADGKNVLDVGCYDGYFLNKGKAREKIGVDLNPVKKYKDIKYIKGDICKLNFKNKKFDQIFAFDVLEHINDDKLFLESLIKLLNKKGKIFLFTPHKEMRIFPPFLTNYINNKWGHHRNGYLENEIRNLLPKNTNIDIEFSYRKELFYRTFYLFLRFMWGISEKITKPFVKFIEFLDNINPSGVKGHLFITLQKNGK